MLARILLLLLPGALAAQTFLPTGKTATPDAVPGAVFQSGVIHFGVIIPEQQGPRQSSRESDLHPRPGRPIWHPPRAEVPYTSRRRSPAGGRSASATVVIARGPIWNLRS